MDDARIDQFDRKILALLQSDARLTNNDLSESVNLSPSQCSRRRQRLEDDGFIRGYGAVLDRDKLGFSLVSVISVTLSTHNRDNARRFGELLSRLPEVQEAHALTGEMDYIVKVVTPDLKSLSEFVNGVLLPHEIRAACEDGDRPGNAEGNRRAAGLRAASGPFASVLDCGLQFDPLDVDPRLDRALCEGEQLYFFGNARKPLAADADPVFRGRMRRSPWSPARPCLWPWSAPLSSILRLPSGR